MSVPLVLMAPVDTTVRSWLMVEVPRSVSENSYTCASWPVSIRVPKVLPG